MMAAPFMDLFGSGGGGSSWYPFGGGGFIGDSGGGGGSWGAPWPDPNIPGFLPAQYGSWSDYLGPFGGNMDGFGGIFNSIFPGENNGIPGGGGGGSQPFSWTSLIPLGVGLGSGLLGSLLSGPSSQQKAAINAQTGLAGQLTANAQQGAGNSALYTAMGLGPIANALKYWNTLATGDRTAMSTALAPEVSQIGQAAQQATDTTSQFAPRGGARTTTLANIPYDTAGKITSLYQTLRPAAVSQLQGLGTTLADLGNTALGGSSSAATSGANSYLNLINTLQGIRQNQQATAANIGTGLYQWAKGIDWSKIFGGSGSGSGTVTNAGAGGSFPGLGV